MSESRLNKLWRGELLCAALVLTSSNAAAEGIFVLKSQSSPPINQALEGFRSVCLEPTQEFDLERNPNRKVEAIKKILAAKPTVVVAFGPQAAELAKAGTGNIPLVFLMVANPQKRGLAGTNIAGVSLNIPAFIQFTNYTNLVRNMKLVGVIYDEKNTGDQIKEAEAAAEKAGLELAAISISSPRDVAGALKTLLGKKIDALWMVTDETVITPDSFSFLQKEANKNKLPFLAVAEMFVEQGALAALSPDYRDMGRQCGEMANEIVKDRQRIAQFDTVPPAKLNLTVNQETARQLGGVVNLEAIKSASKTYK